MSVAILEDDDRPARSDVIQPERQPANAVTPYDMVTQAVMNGASVDVVEKLLALHERWEASRAREAFDAAISEAKAKIPPIMKNRSVGYDSKRTGGNTNYRHEDLAQIARTVDPILAKHGLSYRFRTQQEGGIVRVTCIVSHRDGYSEENALQAGHDTSGSKNSIQAVGSTITYLQRYTLKAALGLSASNDDDAGTHGQTVEDAATISPEQLEELRRVLECTGTDISRFCRFHKIEALPDLPAAQFDSAVAGIKRAASERASRQGSAR